MTDAKVAWSGTVRSVQPRIRLLRSFDQSSHTYLGYVVRLEGTLDGDGRKFAVGVGKAAQEEHQFRVGDRVAGRGVEVPDPRVETVDLYKVSALKVLDRAEEGPAASPPWTGAPPALEVYRERGPRRLAARTYKSKCAACIWGCAMAVEMIVDHWKPSLRRYRREAFCYGPKSCPHYRPGPTRKVPGRKGMSWEEADWVDEEATAHRGPDE
jgi:hypothetical protein